MGGAAEAALKRAIKQDGKAAGVEAGRAGVEAAWPSVTKKPRQLNDGVKQPNYKHY